MPGPFALVISPFALPHPHLHNTHDVRYSPVAMNAPSGRTLTIGDQAIPVDMMARPAIINQGAARGFGFLLNRPAGLQ
jgi:hypothetical protein